MRYILIVQGEGRGHLTQALALSSCLLRNGDQIQKVLVGISPQRELPQFLVEQFPCPVEFFRSPNFLHTDDDKKFKIWKSILYNLRHCRSYFKSIKQIADCIKKHQPERVVSFFEMLTNLAFLRYNLRPTLISVAHQFMYLHPKLRLKFKKNFTHFLLKCYARLCLIKAKYAIALAYEEMPDHRKIKVFPPLIREQVKHINTSKNDFLLGYILNRGFVNDILQFHADNPSIKLEVFCENPPESPDENLLLHNLNSELFLKKLATCRGYFGTAGISSIWEAMFLGKSCQLFSASEEQDFNLEYAKFLNAKHLENFEELKDPITIPPEITEKFRSWTDKFNDRWQKLQ